MIKAKGTKDEQFSTGNGARSDIVPKVGNIFRLGKMITRSIFPNFFPFFFFGVLFLKGETPSCLSTGEIRYRRRPLIRKVTGNSLSDKSRAKMSGKGTFLSTLCLSGEVMQILPVHEPRGKTENSKSRKRGISCGSVLTNYSH
ncbi:hypothetical protein CEXT_228571 [Caerostris extrusa]|uniref:Ribosomal protein L2 n=1 Tax=Caerostris extrusa TaxID=172846 RepID=A0AAV4NBI0_CAEEX|nr:hypothetical protein CEXT_228571 [Caerostris extrusa]